jgi:N6-L-threonylcarbamoyladenine synthase
MLILGIDTSCDDTAASIVEDGVRIISNIVSNQTEIHKKYGGIVPELASRRHIEMILPIVDEALKTTNIKFEDISAVAVCYGPGLIGSLLVGCSFAKAVCLAKDIPLIAVNHLEGHIFSCFLSSHIPEFPFISLIVSGGHTSLYRVDGFGRYKELGRTRDDAAGEAYDKVSKLLGLGYPGGPIIDRLAETGNSEAIDFPRPYLPETFDFSFSGLKTAVRIKIQDTRYMIQDKGNTPLSPPLARGELKGGNVHRASCIVHPFINDVAASFQACIVDVLIKKVEWAVKKEGVQRVTLSGGVSANKELRKRMGELGKEKGIEVFIPPVYLCTDNAAMIAAAGFHHFNSGNFAEPDLNPVAYLPL